MEAYLLSSVSFHGGLLGVSHVSYGVYQRRLGPHCSSFTILYFASIFFIARVETRLLRAIDPLTRLRCILVVSLRRRHRRLAGTLP